MSIVVFGSINMDLVVTVPRLPLAGETIPSESFFTASGGKGANQAVAAAQLKLSPVYFVGQVGADDFGRSLLASLQAAGVKTDAVKINSNIHSGVASIAVAANGDNTIAIAAGANGCVGKQEIEAFKALLENAKIVMLELGIPLDAVLEAAKAAKSAGVTVILDPAPAPSSLPAELYSSIDIITPNEIEASQLAGFPVTDRDSAAAAANFFRAKGVRTAIVTLGADGCFCSSDSGSYTLPAIPQTEVIDTVGAGDAFNGGLAAALAEGKSLKEALQWASVMGALSVTKKGARTMLGDLNQFFSAVDRFSSGK
ncbi:MAG: ribokinase [Prochloraceae cyanobacterium]|nr:ribokinase [Prochloraceae cyanobacterium]